MITKTEIMMILSSIFDKFKKAFFCFLAIFFCLSTSVLAQDQWSLSGFQSPVSVAQFGGFFYLSNSGANFGSAVRDGDGFISRVRSDGTQQEPTIRFVDGFNNPRGMYAIQGVLYVCDIDRLVGIDLRTQRQVFELGFDAENVTQLTAIAPLNNQIIYISATDINTIFEVNISTGSYTKWTETPAPAGLLINDGKMYVAGMGTDGLPNGKLGVIDMRTKNYTQLIDNEGIYFGLALNGNRLYYSDWVQFARRRGVVRWFDLNSRATGQVAFTTRIGGPGDFIFDPRNNLFIIPSVLEDIVYGCMGFVD